MRWRTAGKASQVLIILVTLGLAAAWGYEFYAPLVGLVAAGDEQQAQPAVPRNLAVVKAEAYMGGQPGRNLPTLADIILFYGLEEDTITCAVQENHGEAASPGAIPVLASRPIEVGEEVILCLD